MIQWAREFGIPYHTLFERFKSGWGVGKALTTPLRAMKTRVKAAAKRAPRLF